MPISATDCVAATNLAGALLLLQRRTHCGHLHAQRLGKRFHGLSTALERPGQGGLVRPLLSDLGNSLIQHGGHIITGGADT